MVAFTISSLWLLTDWRGCLAIPDAHASGIILASDTLTAESLDIPQRVFDRLTARDTSTLHVSAVILGTWRTFRNPRLEGYARLVLSNQRVLLERSTWRVCVP